MKNRVIYQGLIVSLLVSLLPSTATFAADSGAPAPAPAPVAAPAPLPSVTPTPTPSPSATATSTPTPSPSPSVISVIRSVDDDLKSVRESISVMDFKGARAALIETNQLFPNNADVNNLLGFTSRKMKMYSSAGKYYAQALAIDPNHLGALEYQGELFLLTKRTAQAKKNLAKLKAICGVNCEEYQDLKKALTKK